MLVIVAAVADPPLRTGLIDRYLVAAWRGGIEPMLALTKIDLPYDAGEVARAREIYEGLGHRVIELSLRTGTGVDELRGALAGRVAVLAGHSGVGKTSLTNELTGRTDATGALNPVSDRGRHTTTGARYIDLPGGGALIDTAGIRSFGIAGVAASELEKAFPEIAAPPRTANGKAACTRGRGGPRVNAAPAIARAARLLPQAAGRARGARGRARLVGANRLALDAGSASAWRSGAAP